MGNNMRDLEGKRRRREEAEKERKAWKVQKVIHAEDQYYTSPPNPPPVPPSSSSYYPSSSPSSSPLSSPAPSPSPSPSSSPSPSPLSSPSPSPSSSPSPSPLPSPSSSPSPLPSSSPSPSPSPSSSDTDEDGIPSINPIPNLQTPANQVDGTDDSLPPHPVQVIQDNFYKSCSSLSRKNGFMARLHKYFELDQPPSGAQHNPIIINDSSEPPKDRAENGPTGTCQNPILVDGDAPTNPPRLKGFPVVPSPAPLLPRPSTHIFTVVFRGEEGSLSATFSTVLTNSLDEFFNLSCDACGLKGYQMGDNDHVEVSISAKSIGKKAVYSGPYRVMVWRALMELIGLMPQSDVVVYFLDHVFV